MKIFTMKRAILVDTHGCEHHLNAMKKLLEEYFREYCIIKHTGHLPKTWASWEGVRLIINALRAKIYYKIWGTLEFDNMLHIMYGMGRNIIMHWVGTDVLRAISNPYAKQLAEQRCLKGIYHWADAPWLVEELGSIGINATWVPVASAVNPPKEIPPLPSQFTVLCYLPASRPDFYGKSKIYRLARDFPKVRFLVVGSQRQDNETPDNIQYLGWRSDMEDIYAKSSVLIRLTEHDGLSVMVLEALSFARYVIWTYSIPGVFCAKDYDSLKEYLKNIQQKAQVGELNMMGHEYFRDTFTPHILRSRIAQELQKICC